MKIIFAGTPEFAVPSLLAVLNSSHKVQTVFTQPDRPAGRGRHLHASLVKQTALAHGIPVMQPTTLKDPAIQAQIAELNCDVMVVVAYGLLLPQAVLAIPTFGCINVHASLLPKWRGAAPIQHAILAGDQETGICIMQMEAGLDTGPVLLSEKMRIDAKDTGGSMHDKLAQLGASTLLAALSLVEAGIAHPKTQTHDDASYAHKINKADAQINWATSVVAIDRLIRAFSPWPIAYTHLEGQTIRIHAAEIINETTTNNPGTILKVDASGIEVACQVGVLRLTEIQLQSAKRLPVKDVLHGHPLMFQTGMCFAHE